MISDKEALKLGKFLSLVLRHQPEIIGIELDENGWADVEQLIVGCNKKGNKLDFEKLKYIVENNNKKRYAFNEDCTKIRASQGHSIEVELGYTAQEPPEMLYHGTAEQHIESIFKTGLEKRQRQHVHLSADTQTATKVGQRHGKAVIIAIKAVQMYQDGFEFFISDNGVWLTDHVPTKYFQILEK
ncbi:MAG: RNA 2'-phosphotransferase [Raineya sp.]|jgi:putative RNA 2'-phosphotransferase|nr:RNA 2'-phosphotransferase [Raineya sp.]